ncbi:putative ribonuclease H-like domain-containing protein [Tanacetum coccineum]|uniref:Ribonuclease H-like domain-containing protein n=1 Tax=Tanacetum coccineum TaxID=301880 RepID=A0ABQ5FPH0_9ASTR
MDNIRPITSSLSRTPHKPQRPKKIVKSIWVKKGSTVATQAVLPQTVKESVMMKSNQTWRPKGAYLDSVNRDNGSYTLKKFEYGNPEEDLKDYAIIDSGCSGSMTGDKDKLSDFKEFKGGYVAFGNDSKGGRISGKGTIKTSCIDFEKVSYVEELKFNLLSVSQICDKKHNVLFTDKECLILSPKFKFVDEDLVILRAPRKNDVYSLDLKNIIPSGGITCLVAKATKDEAVLWHRRLGHVNFKNINKLVKGNLVRGLPSKTFKLDHSCLACRKGKQHRASCKKIEERTVREPLELLHMDLFGPVSVESVNRKKYCLVVTDDCSKFSWVFFLAYKDETYDMLHDLIVGLENKLRHKVKTIRCDHGTEFKNQLMNEFCAKKGIKREYSIARTPQQNGVAERKNRTLIEAARTMLADSLLPIQFWAEAVNTACYVLNRVLDHLGKFAWQSQNKKRTADKEVPLSSDDQALHDELVNLMHQESLAKLHNDAQRHAFEEEKRRIALEKGKESVNSTFTLNGCQKCILIGNITEEVYVKQPPGFEDLAHPNKSYRSSQSTVMAYIKPHEHGCYYLRIYKSSMVKDLKILSKRNSKMSSMRELTFFWASSQNNFAGIFSDKDEEGEKLMSFFIDFKSLKVVLMLGQSMLDDQLQRGLSISWKEDWFLECKKTNDLWLYHYRGRIGILFFTSRPALFDSTSTLFEIVMRAEGSLMWSRLSLMTINADFFKSSIISLDAQLIPFVSDPVLSGPWLQQFWATASLRVINDVPHIRAMVAGKKILISEETIRADLLFDDAHGVDCFPKQVIWDSLRDIGYKVLRALSWEQFGTKHRIWLLFIQLFLNKQLEGVTRPKNFLPSVTLPSKVFTFMRKHSPKFSCRITPLTPPMLEVVTALAAEEEHMLSQASIVTAQDSACCTQESQILRSEERSKGRSIRRSVLQSTWGGIRMKDAEKKEKSLKELRSKAKEYFKEPTSLAQERIMMNFLKWSRIQEFAKAKAIHDDRILTIEQECTRMRVKEGLSVITECKVIDSPVEISGWENDYMLAERRNPLSRELMIWMLDSWKWKLKDEILLRLKTSDNFEKFADELDSFSIFTTEVMKVDLKRDLHEEEFQGSLKSLLMNGGKCPRSKNSNISDEPSFNQPHPYPIRLECFCSRVTYDEIDDFLAIEVSSNFEEGYFDSEGDITFLDNLLSDDDSHNLVSEVITDHEPEQIGSSITFSPRRLVSPLKRIDIFLVQDDLIPPGVENDDSEDEVNELPNLDHQDYPSIPRPPLEPPDIKKCF